MTDKEIGKLMCWGEDVKVAISNSYNEIVFKTLKELSPFYWRNDLN